MKLRHKAALCLLAAGGAAALGLHLALPAFLKRKVNAKLAHLENYVGHVDGVSVRLWRGALRFENLTLVVRGSKSDVPLVHVRAIDAEYSWKALVHGGFVGDVALHHPVVHYVKPPKREPEAGPQPRPKETVEIAKKSAGRAQAQSAAYIRRLDVVGGRLEWQDDEVRPGYVLEFSTIEAVAFNIGAKPGLAKPITRAELSGFSTGHGKLRLRLEAEALAAKPTFKYELEITSASLPAFNEWLRKNLNIEARDGVLNLYTEARAVDGKVAGYVEPLVVGLHSVRVRGGSSIPKQFKGEMEKMASRLFRNEESDQLGTRVDFSGSLDDPKVHPLEALVELVRNAFVKALKPDLRGTAGPDKL